jgi:short-subunit dehydrogenase
MLKNDRILVTGASHGIGRRTALRLGAAGARVGLVGRSAGSLEELAHEIEQLGGVAIPFVVDLLDGRARARLVPDAIECLGGLDRLVNIAGSTSFTPFDQEGSDDLTDLVNLNVLAPMELTRDAVAHFKTQRAGHVVNVGSIFGSIGFPHFVAYSATKFAIRGFSQALRRELVDFGVDVTYVAPRATDTRLARAFAGMAKATGMHLDDPDDVAARIVSATEKRATDVYLGGPEGIFVRLNSAWPQLVDRLMRKQTRQARPFAEEAALSAADRLVVREEREVA